MSNEIEAKIRSIIKENIEVGTNVYEVGNEKNLVNYGLNSISFIKIVVAIEEQFEIEFNDEDLVSFDSISISYLVSYVSKKLQNKGLF